jgi:crotonobetainyl-CoA:carnitine CoA-transferase CaiB-like acyl-CoA transferase
MAGRGAMMSKGLLSGVTVIDLGRVLAAPLAAQCLADMGAEVLKIERPGYGDDARSYGPPFLKDVDGSNTDQTAFFLSANRNKKSITIDYAKPAGRALLKRLITGADVLIENFKTGTLRKYDLHFDAVHRLNPRLVYCSISGFGQTGPLSHRPGFDGIFQAMSGLMSTTGQPDGRPGEGPLRVGISIVDVLTAYQAVIGILAALRASEDSGVGQHIDVALLDCAIAAMSHGAQLFLMTGEVPRRSGNGSFAGAPSGTFRCAVGMIYVVGSNNHQFAGLCRTIGRLELLKDERYATVVARITNREALNAELQGDFLSRTAEEWTELLDEAGVPAGPVLDLEQVFAQPQVKHRRVVRSAPHPTAGVVELVANPLNFSDAPIDTYVAPPQLGADTQRVLVDRLGLSQVEIDELRRVAAI